MTLALTAGELGGSRVLECCCIFYYISPAALVVDFIHSPAEVYLPAIFLKIPQSKRHPYSFAMPARPSVCLHLNSLLLENCNLVGSKGSFLNSSTLTQHEPGPLKAVVTPNMTTSYADSLTCPPRPAAIDIDLS
ncbi:hypothetical protein EVAR_6263_1 [Eumeta japonica]|uniref:Uncharacterized protein n=1 Tax=Eumeta variegata TaxID=151549 RepID=A0A4C1T864_EUMVA|nr:hypothetical protein EVAR_6263_1 [Eumeta japonica]